MALHMQENEREALRPGLASGVLTPRGRGRVETLSVLNLLSRLSTEHLTADCNSHPGRFSERATLHGRPRFSEVPLRARHCAQVATPGGRTHGGRSHVSAAEEQTDDVTDARRSAGAARIHVVPNHYS